MKKWKKVLIWIVSVLVVLGTGSLLAANYAVDKLMNSMAESVILDESEPSNEAADAKDPSVDTGGPSTAPAVVLPDDNSAALPAKDNSTANSEAAPVVSAVPVLEQVEASNGVDSAGKPKPSAEVKVKPQASSPSTSLPSTNTGYTAQVSTDKAKEIQKNVTVKDKADVASIVLGQLSISDIKRLQELASGGLTIEEKREARRIILDNVSEGQYNQLSEIAKKYGVSQGKTRDEIIAEEEAIQEHEQN